MNTLYRPELLYVDDKFVSGGELLVSPEGFVLKCDDDVDRSVVTIVEMPGKALMPGFVNTHSLVSAPDSWKGGVAGAEWARLLVVARNDVLRRKPTRSAAGV